MGIIPSTGRKTTRRRRRGRTPVIRFYVPRNFNAQDVLPPALARYADCAHYLLHLIVRARVTWQAGADGFVSLKIVYLRRVIPKHIEKELRTALIARGVIECDGRFIVGSKAMSYRLASAYQLPARPVFCTDQRLAAKVAGVRDTEFRCDLHLPVHLHLHQWLHRVWIDRDRAERIILTTPALAEHADLHLTAVAMIDDGAFDFTYCRMGRVHTNITRLPRALRPCLHIGTEPLVNVDVKCCQPLLLGALLLQYRLHGNRPTSPRRFSNRVRNPYAISPIHNVGCVEAPVPISTVISSSGGGWGGASLRVDEGLYLRLCERGRLYEHLAGAAGPAGGDRDALKVAFYTDVLFDRGRRITRFARAFASEFPAVWELIREVKRDDHRLLALLLQNVESTLIIGRACQRLMMEHPHVPLVTIHDSITTTPGHADTVARIMRETFQQVGVTPSLKVERPSVVTHVA